VFHQDNAPVNRAQETIMATDILGFEPHMYFFKSNLHVNGRALVKILANNQSYHCNENR